MKAFFLRQQIFPRRNDFPFAHVNVYKSPGPGSLLDFADGDVCFVDGDGDGSGFAAGFSTDAPLCFKQTTRD
jgi:hypothetical protein